MLPANAVPPSSTGSILDGLSRVSECRAIGDTLRVVEAVCDVVGHLLIDAASPPPVFSQLLLGVHESALHPKAELVVVLDAIGI